MLIHKKFKSTLAAFANDIGGNYSVIFAIVLIPLLMGAGIAVDFTRMISAKTQMQDALDAALLSTTKAIATGKVHASNAQSAVQKFMEANLNKQRADIAAAKILNFKFDPSTITISADVQTDLVLAFPVFGSGNTRKVATTAAASYRARKVEVSMVLDVTLSMAQDAKEKTDFTKINNLKVAAKAGIAEFIDHGNDNTRVALVPYGYGVNAGALQYYVREENGKPARDYCAAERRGKEMFTDASPIGAPITRPAMINYVRLGISRSDRFWCPDTAIVPLTKNKNVLNAAIDSLTPKDSTAGHIGLQWGRYMLSPNWKSVLPASAEPSKYNTPDIDKVLILMTDGMFNSEASGLTGASVAKYPGITSLSGRLAMTHCEAIKAQNIKIYTIGFRLKDIADAGEQTEATRLLADCASTPIADEVTFFDADNGAELTAAFKEIAKRVEVVTLTN